MSDLACMASPKRTSGSDRSEVTESRLSTGTARRDHGTAERTPPASTARPNRYGRISLADPLLNAGAAIRRAGTRTHPLGTCGRCLPSPGSRTRTRTRTRTRILLHLPETPSRKSCEVGHSRPARAWLTGSREYDERGVGPNAGRDDDELPARPGAIGQALRRREVASFVNVRTWLLDRSQPTFCQRRS